MRDIHGHLQTRQLGARLQQSFEEPPVLCSELGDRTACADISNRGVDDRRTLTTFVVDACTTFAHDNNIAHTNSAGRRIPTLAHFAATRRTRLQCRLRAVAPHTRSPEPLAHRRLVPCGFVHRPVLPHRRSLGIRDELRLFRVPARRRRVRRDAPAACVHWLMLPLYSQPDLQPLHLPLRALCHLPHPLGHCLRWRPLTPGCAVRRRHLVARAARRRCHPEGRRPAARVVVGGGGARETGTAPGCKGLGARRRKS
mmetsp:Transcript_53038/g.152841  ORF Transcript_53038/g.152841 Transcript_53038/m.152841 type:complete len:255 (+) Transcript_53038:1014-1778(+)